MSDISNVKCPRSYHRRSSLAAERQIKRGDKVLQRRVKLSMGDKRFGVSVKLD